MQQKRADFLQIVKIQKRKGRGERVNALSVRADKEKGIEGSMPPKTPERQISLMAGELLPEIRNLGGHCTSRFKADMETNGLDYSALSVGTRLKTGTAVIEITAVGKRCFEECPIRQKGEQCPLPRHCAFGRVAEDGEISVGDEMVVL